MSFALNVSTLFNGAQHSSRLTFSVVPTVGDLLLAAEANFREKLNAAYRAASAQVYDAALERWVELHSAHQLVADAQIFFLSTDAPLRVTSPSAHSPVAAVSPVAVAAAASLAAASPVADAFSPAPASRYVVNALPPSLKPGVTSPMVAGSPVQTTQFSPPMRIGSIDAASERGRSPPAVVPQNPAVPTLDVGSPLYTVPPHVAPNTSETDAIAAQVARSHEVRRAAVLGWTPEIEAADRMEREAKRFDLDVQIRQLTTRNHLDRIRSLERAENDSMALAKATALGAQSPPRVRHDLCRMYCSPTAVRQISP